LSLALLYGSSVAPQLPTNHWSNYQRRKAMKEKNKKNDDLSKQRDSNPDPITGAPGSHPVGTGLGAAAGGAGGMAAGAAAGAAIGASTTGPTAPIGAAIGAVVGAVGGGLAGKGIAEKIDPTAEDAYWREHYQDRPYVRSGSSYDDYQPAYRYGVEARQQHPDKSWDDVRDELRSGWNHRRGESSLNWDDAEQACCDAWEHCGQRGSSSSSQSQQPPAV
jgi:hypothetical protein